MLQYSGIVGCATAYSSRISLGTNLSSCYSNSDPARVPGKATEDCSRDPDEIPGLGFPGAIGILSQQME